ncbi:MAG: hypothetical protein WBC04_07065 [Candidatus Acidiferrales bacterium]
MKRLFTIVTVVVLSLAASGLLLAQSNPTVGTWKLNLAKSKYNPGPPPKSLTWTVEAQGAGAKVTYQGVAGDGSPIAYGYTVNYDGKDYPMTGSGTPNGADTIAVKRIDSNTFEETSKKAAKVVLTTRTVVSKDGKTTIMTSRGTDTNGLPMDRVIVWDKQ